MLSKGQGSQRQKAENIFKVQSVSSFSNGPGKADLFKFMTIPFPFLCPSFKCKERNWVWSHLGLGKFHKPETSKFSGMEYKRVISGI